MRSSRERASASSASSPAPSIIPTPATPSRRSQASQYRALFDDPIFNSAVFKTPCFVPDLGPSFVYRHVRTLRGIEATFSTPRAEDVQAPSSGPAADMFLQAFGFDLPSRLLIARALQTSPSMADFVSTLSARGLPVLEAKYIYLLHESNRPRPGAWSQTHIM